MAKIKQTYQYRSELKRLAMAVTTLDGFSQWWTSSVSKNSDNILRLRFGSFSELNLKKVTESQNSVTYQCEKGVYEGVQTTWTGTEVKLSWKTLDSNLVELTLIHDGFPSETDETYVSCTGGWKYFLDQSLRGYLEKGKGMPMSDQSESCATQESKKKNAINWFEIPVVDFDRARKFYSTVLGEEIQSVNYGETQMGFLPADKDAVTGALIKGNGMEPNDKGTLVYLNGGSDLSVPLGRVEVAGGKVLLPKIAIGEYGYIGRFRDTEGNLVAFHSER